MSRSTVKIAVVGPTRAGKTAISNFLANISEHPSSNYDPTIAARILEFEKDLSRIGSVGMFHGSSGVRVELWDVSGDKRFESCWPAIVKDVNGVVIVFNPDNPDDERQLDIWYNRFVEHGRIKESQCIVYAHRPNANRLPSVHLSSQRLSRVQVVGSSFEVEPNSIKVEFERFLVSVVSAVATQQGLDEDHIVNT